MPNSLYSDLCDVYDEGEKPYLFISYAHEDTTKVVAAIRGLQRLGYRIWYDMGISAGAQWPEDVADHIYGCDAMLAFMTPNSIQSDNCREELFYAKKCNKKILLAYLEKCDLSHGMDMRLGMLQAIERWRCKDDEEFYTRLAKAKNLQPCRGEIESGDSASAIPEPTATSTSDKPKTKIEQLLEKAKKGDAQAQFNLGWAYRQGNGVPQNDTEAANWYRKAAEQGHSNAQFNLGCCYDLGDGVPQDYTEAVKWYQKAADHNNMDAKYNLAVLYKDGNGVPKNHKKAFDLYQEVADTGDCWGQNALAHCYECAIGTKKDLSTALDLYRKSAEQGFADAQYNLGLCYKYSRGVAQDWDEAARWYRKAAEQGFAKAQKQMAECYRKGLGVPIDEAEAARWQKLYDENPNKK